MLVSILTKWKLIVPVVVLESLLRCHVSERLADCDEQSIELVFAFGDLMCDEEIGLKEELIRVCKAVIRKFE